MSRAMMLRLETYLVYLEQLKADGVTTATSYNLAKILEISDSRVRQDLLSLGVTGKPRTGYVISELEAAVIHALDVKNIKRIALVGFGNLGRALAGSAVWERSGFDLRAIFDNDPSTIGTEYVGLKVKSISELFGVIRTQKIECACLAVPASAAQSVADLLVTADIKGIWNFSPAQLKVPMHVVVENQRLAQGLMALSYRMKDEIL